MRESLMAAMILAAVSLTAIMPMTAANAQINPFGKSGFELSESDIKSMGAAARPLFENEETTVGAANEWSNEETGNHGTVSLIGKHEYQGLPCRRLQHDIWLEKMQRNYRYIIDRCRTEDGSWKIL